MKHDHGASDLWGVKPLSSRTAGHDSTTFRPKTNHSLSKSLSESTPCDDIKQFLESWSCELFLPRKPDLVQSSFLSHVDEPLVHSQASISMPCSSLHFCYSANPTSSSHLKARRCVTRVQVSYGTVADIPGMQIKPLFIHQFILPSHLSSLCPQIHIYNTNVTAGLVYSHNITAREDEAKSDLSFNTRIPNSFSIHTNTTNPFSLTVAEPSPMAQNPESTGLLVDIDQNDVDSSNHTEQEQLDVHTNMMPSVSSQGIRDITSCGPGERRAKQPRFPGAIKYLT